MLPAAARLLLGAPLGTVLPTVTFPLELTLNKDAPLELAMLNREAGEVDEPTMENKDVGVVVLMPMLPEL